MRNRASVILTKFLIFGLFEAHNSYKKYSYTKKHCRTFSPRLLRQITNKASNEASKITVHQHSRKVYNKSYNRPHQYFRNRQDHSYTSNSFDHRNQNRYNFTPRPQNHNRSNSFFKNNNHHTRPIPYKKLTQWSSSRKKHASPYNHPLGVWVFKHITTRL